MKLFTQQQVYSLPDDEVDFNQLDDNQTSSKEQILGLLGHAMAQRQQKYFDQMEEKGYNNGDSVGL